jgi:hypothetical protein
VLADTRRKVNGHLANVVVLKAVDKLKIASSSQIVVISPVDAACSHSAVCDDIEPSAPLV